DIVTPPFAGTSSGRATQIDTGDGTADAQQFPVSDGLAKLITAMTTAGADQNVDFAATTYQMKADQLSRFDDPLNCHFIADHTAFAFMMQSDGSAPGHGQFAEELELQFDSMHCSQIKPHQNTSSRSPTARNQIRTLDQLALARFKKF